MDFSTSHGPVNPGQPPRPAEKVDRLTEPKGGQGAGPNLPIEDISPGYYGLPVLKTPVWRWEVWAYFFLGGLAAGSFVVASLARLFGDVDDRPIWRTGYLISLLAVLGCPPFLIKDLGRPARFLNMLRIFKPQSPMSLGVWGLLGFSGCALGQALISLRADVNVVEVGRPRRGSLNRGVAALGTVLGLFLGSYTGVLLSVTSVPLWSRSRLLGPTFLASALSSGTAAVSLGLLVSGQTTPKREAALDRFKLVTLIAEAIGLTLFLRETGRAARPLFSFQQMGRSFLLGAVGLGVGVPIFSRLLAGSSCRFMSGLSAVATLIGSLLLRRSIVEAGHWSAEDAEMTFWHTDRAKRGAR